MAAKPAYVSNHHYCESQACEPKGELAKLDWCVVPALLPKMIHVLGKGSIGSCVAVNLAQSGPVRFLLRSREEQLKHQSMNETVSIRDRDCTESARVPGDFKGDTGHVENLIVAVKAHHTLDALQSVQDKISSNTNILLLQNGMGQKDQLFSTLWPEEQHRPSILRGIIPFGVKPTHISNYFVKSGTAPAQIEKIEETCYLAERFKAASSLFTSNIIDQEEMTIKQLEKLVVNCAINPVTAILDCKNGSLLNNDGNTLLRLAVAECCKIIQTAAQNTLSKTTQLKYHSLFSPSRMLDITLAVCRDTAENRSSMCVDTNSGYDTEIEYINGYIQKLAAANNLSSKCNSQLIAMVKLKLRTVRAQLSLKDNHVFK